MMHAPASTADDLAHGATEAPRPPRERTPPPAPVGPPRRASV
jgi:hypothetical protein